MFRRILFSATLLATPCIAQQEISLQNQGKIPEVLLIDQFDPNSTIPSSSELLSGGRIVYNEALLAYLLQIADRVNDGEKLEHVFAFRSNLAKAFTSRDGVLFVTTGLVSHCADEAQLAYVMANQLAHMKLGHSPEQPYLTSNSKEVIGWDARISDLDTYTDEQELEADLLAFDKLIEAGYDISGIRQTLEMERYENTRLLFSTSIDLDWISGPLCHLDSAWIQKGMDTTRIKVKEESNRKDKRDIEFRRKVREQGGKGSIFVMDEQKFWTTQRVCRVDHLENALGDEYFLKALYECRSMLERTPDDSQLKYMEMMIWNAIMNQVNYANVKPTFRYQGQKEAGASMLKSFITCLNPFQLNTLAMRRVTDLNNELATPQSNRVWALCVAEATIDGNLDIGKFSTDPNPVDEQEWLTLRDSLHKGIREIDSLASAATERSDQLRLLQKKRKLQSQLNRERDDHIELLWLSDLVESQAFADAVSYGDSLATDGVDRNEAIYNAERAGDGVFRSKENTPISNMLVAPPYIQAIHHKKGKKNEASNRIERRVTSELSSMATQFGYKANFMGEQGERSDRLYVLNRFLSTPLEKGRIPQLSVVWEETELIRKETGCDHFFISTFTGYNNDASLGYGWAYALYPPILVGILVYKLMSANSTSFTGLIVDLGSGETTMAITRSYNSKMRAMELEAQLYDLFWQLKNAQQ